MNDGEVVQAGGVLVDGLGIGDVGTVVLRDRRHLSQDGLVVVVVTMASGEGELLGMPEISSRGFIYVKDNDELITDAKKVVIDVIERQHNLSGGDWTNLKNQMRTSLNKYFYEKTKRSPMILPIVVEI